MLPNQIIKRCYFLHTEIQGCFLCTKFIAGAIKSLIVSSLGVLIQQALQKDIQTNARALNEVISSSKKFLEENRSKLTPEQIADIEDKLEEAKSKANMLNEKAEESRKDLEKVVTTAIKQETEKVGRHA